MKPLLVTDLDGTLLRSDATMSGYTVGVLTQALRAGVPLTYATARSRQTSAPLVSSLPWVLPAIIYNGAFVIDPGTGLPLVSNLLDEASAAEVVAAGLRRGVTPFVFGLDNGREIMLYTPPQNDGQRDFLETRLRRGDPRLTPVEKIVPPREVIEVQFTAPRAQLLDLAEWAKAASRGALSVSLSRDVYTDGYYNLEVSHVHANKKDMLRWLATDLRVDLNAVTVFGDGHNDLPMFEVAGRRVAVGNAHPDVLARADEVIATNDEDGVARYVEALLTTGG